MPKIAVVGTRNLHDYNVVKFVLDEYREQGNNIALIVSGGAKGVDYFAERYAKENGIPLLIYPVGYSDNQVFGWNTHGKSAGAIRNKKIIDAVTVVFAFPSHNGRGTQITMDMAKKAKKELHVYYVGTIEHE